MENDQDKIREAVLRRCNSQKSVAEKVGCTDVYLNVWLKGHKDLGEETLSKVIKWLDE